MLTLIKKHLPQPIKRTLAPVYQRTIGQWQKRRLFLRMQKKHQALLAQIKGKERIRVVFLAIHKSVWKVDPVFQKMLADPFFDPIILVCPYTAYGEERMWEDMRECLAYFNEKDYPTHSSYNLAEQRWIKLKELTPDIVFFTNPHNLTCKEYYEDAYLNYLSCYVPYHHEVGSFGDNNSQHNQPFHNSVWKIFAAHNDSFLLAKKIAGSRAKNVETTGFPAVENLIKSKRSANYLDVWKTNDGRKRIIFAPHHLIHDEISQSNFLQYADFFKYLAKRYQKKAIWAFKPHPILKSKLLESAGWGAARTQAYFDFWENQEYTQLELGAYEDLFLSSDAMIHDCGSFLAEYLYAEKPVLYMLNNRHHGQFFNSFGVKALASCRIAKAEIEIEQFLLKIIDGSINGVTEAQKIFLHKDINPYYLEKLPSFAIVEKIKRAFGYEN